MKSKFNTYLEQVYYDENFLSNFIARVRNDPSHYQKKLNIALSKIDSTALNELNKILKLDISETEKFEAVKKFIQENREKFNLQKDTSTNEDFFQGDKFLKKAVGAMAALIVSMSLVAGWGIHENIKTKNEFIDYEKKGMAEAIRKKSVINVAENVPQPVNMYPGQTVRVGGGGMSMYYKITPPSESYYIVYKYGPRGNQKVYKKPITKEEFIHSKLPTKNDDDEE